MGKFYLHITLFLFLLIPLGSQAQQLLVQDAENGQPLIGATISVSGQQLEKVHYATDLHGKLWIPRAQQQGNEQLIVEVSYIGYENYRDTISTGQNYTFKLAARPYMQDEVVVTAQYAPTSLENSVHKVRVISSRKIEQMAAVNLQDVLTNELNIRLSRDNILGAGMSLQGVSGQNVKILIDGVPVIGRLDGQIDLNQINLNEVERIEIVEGPLGVNYGSNALAGTINIITKKEMRSKVRVGLTSYNENIGTFNNTLNAGYSINKDQSLRFSIGRNYFDGWSLGDEVLPNFSRQRADSGRVDQWHPKEQYFGRLQYNHRLKDILLTYKLEGFDETIYNYGFPRRSLNTYIAFDDYYHTRRIDNALMAQGKMNKNFSLNAIAAINYFQRIKESRRKDLVTLKDRRVPETAGDDTQDTSTFDLYMSRASIATNFDSFFLNGELGYDINYELASGARIDGGEQHMPLPNWGKQYK